VLALELACTNYLFTIKSTMLTSLMKVPSLKLIVPLPYSRHFNTPVSSSPVTEITVRITEIPQTKSDTHSRIMLQSQKSGICAQPHQAS
jgi:hypothetical protein